MVFGIIGDKFRTLWRFIFGRLPSNVRKFLNKYGDLNIKSIVIKKAPILKVLDKVLNFLSLGKYEKIKQSYAYDDLFHLYIIITLSNGMSFIFEKNHIINISSSIPQDTDKTQSLSVSISNEFLTVNTMLENAIKTLGEDRILVYDAFNWNCQRFILDILETNGLSNKDINTFVLQPVDKMAEELGLLRTVAKTLTDVVGYADEMKQSILGFKKGGRVKKRNTKLRI